MEYITRKIPIFVINLEKRVDRWKAFNKINKTESQSYFDFIKFKASEGTPGWLHCALSHLLIVEKAMNDNLPYVIVMEDDNQFTKFDYDYLKKMVSWLEVAPDEWDIFNGNPSCVYMKRNQKVTQVCGLLNLYRYEYGRTTNFMIYNGTIFKKLLKMKKLYENIETKIKENNSLASNTRFYDENSYDHLLNKVATKYVTVLPYITKQFENDHSDIMNQSVNYSQNFRKSEGILTKNIQYNGTTTGTIKGGLGNQLFIISNFYCFSRINPNRVTILNNNIKKRSTRNDDHYNTIMTGLNIFKPITNGIEKNKLNRISYKEPTCYNFNIGSGILMTKNSDVNIKEYLQCIRYIQKYYNEIRVMLQPSSNIINHIDQRYSNILNEHITIAIHVRRTDYVAKTHYHHVLPVKYYSHSINIIKEIIKGNEEKRNVSWLIFSDDMDWCKQQFSSLLKNEDIIFVNEDSSISLYLMSICTYKIIANSTFSWWAAYLNYGDNWDRNVIAPTKWLEKEEIKEIDLFMPSDWIKILPAVYE